MAYSDSHDDVIIAEAVRSGVDLPIVRIPLYGAVAPTDPNAAEVNFMDTPPTVRRYKLPVLTAADAANIPKI